MKKITKAMLFAGAVAAVAGAFTGCVNDVEAEKTYVEIKAPNVEGLKAEAIESGRALLITWTPTATALHMCIISPSGYVVPVYNDAGPAFDAGIGYAVVPVSNDFSLKQDDMYTIVVANGDAGLKVPTGVTNTNTIVNQLESAYRYTYKSDVTSPDVASKLTPYTSDDVKVYFSEDKQTYDIVYAGDNTHGLYGQSVKYYIAGTDIEVADADLTNTASFPYIGSSVDVKIKKTWANGRIDANVAFYQPSDEYVTTITAEENPAGEDVNVSNVAASATNYNKVDLTWESTSDVNKTTFKIYKAAVDADGKIVGVVELVSKVGTECIINDDAGTRTYEYFDSLGDAANYTYYVVAINSKGYPKNTRRTDTFGSDTVRGNYDYGTPAYGFVMKAEAAVNEGKFAFTWIGDKNTDYTLYYTTVDYRGVESERKPLEASSSTYDLAKNEYAFNSKLAYNPSSAVETQKYNFYLVSSKDDKLLGTDVRDYTLPNAKVAYATVDTDLEVSANKVTIKGTKLNYATKPTVISIKKDGENKWTEKKVTFNLNTANTELSANVEIAAGTEVRVMLDKTKIMGLGDYTDAEEELWGRY